MAKVQRSHQHRFSLENDPLFPTVILWRWATPAELAKYQGAKAAALAGVGPVPTTKHYEGVAAAQLDFAVGLIEGAQSWELEDGSLVSTRDQVIEHLDDVAPGLLTLFVNAVIQAHYPATVAAMKEATGGTGN